MKSPLQEMLRNLYMREEQINLVLPKEDQMLPMLRVESMLETSRDLFLEERNNLLAKQYDMALKEVQKSKTIEELMERLQAKDL